MKKIMCVTLLFTSSFAFGQAEYEDKESGILSRKYVNWLPPNDYLDALKRDNNIIWYKFPSVFRKPGNDHFPYERTIGLQPGMNWQIVTGTILPSPVILDMIPGKQPQWSFPNGSTFIELMFVVSKKQESFVFEVRVRKKVDGEFQDKVFIPEAFQDVASNGNVQYNVKLPLGPNDSLITYKSIMRRVEGIDPSALKNLKFVEGDNDLTCLTTESIVPTKYFGSVVSCNECHKDAENERGSDFVFSFLPLDLKSRPSEKLIKLGLVKLK